LLFYERRFHITSFCRPVLAIFNQVGADKAKITIHAGEDARNPGPSPNLPMEAFDDVDGVKQESPPVVYYDRGAF
jgi:hypothetical protein